MNMISRLLHSVGRDDKRAGRSQSKSLNFRPTVELLEDRSVPSVVSSISSNFNGTAIPAGDDIWFSSVAKVQGVGSSPVTIHVTNQTISFTANSTNYTVAVPDSTVTLTPGATTATATFSSGWDTSVPSHFSGNLFLGGMVFQAVGGLPGGIHNVNWTASFSADTAGLTVNWQWAAAVYTNFASDNSGVNVKAVDDNHFGPYANSDHAGTPENFKDFVVGGATGGGGSNWTGSYSATASVKPDVQTQVTTASLSGFVTDAQGTSGIFGVTIILTQFDNLGNVLATFTATTDANGYYTFSGVPAGNYTVAEDTSTLPSLFMALGSSAGTVGINTDGTSSTPSLISSITLNAGDVGVNYDFTAGPVIG
jgi:hypothetical protein